MYKDLIEENLELKARIYELENAITEHAQRIRTVGYSNIDRELWYAIGLHVYTEEEKQLLDEEALRFETEAQLLAEGAI